MIRVYRVDQLQYGKADLTVIIVGLREREALPFAADHAAQKIYQNGGIIVLVDVQAHREAGVLYYGKGPGPAPSGAVAGAGILHEALGQQLLQLLGHRWQGQPQPAHNFLLADAFRFSVNHVVDFTVVYFFYAGAHSHGRHLLSESCPYHSTF